jgi:hypothetical protein
MVPILRFFPRQGVPFVPLPSGEVASIAPGAEAGVVGEEVAAGLRVMR